MAGSVAASFGPALGSLTLGGTATASETPPVIFRPDDGITYRPFMTITARPSGITVRPGS
jgi:hypothetical protein